MQIICTVNVEISSVNFRLVLYSRILSMVDWTKCQISQTGLIMSSKSWESIVVAHAWNSLRCLHDLCVALLAVGDFSLLCHTNARLIWLCHLTAFSSHFFLVNIPMGLVSSTLGLLLNMSSGMLVEAVEAHSTWWARWFRLGLPRSNSHDR